MKKFFFNLSMLIMWGIGAFLWLDAYFQSASATVYEQKFFGTGSVVLFIITAVFLFNSIKYLKYWTEEGKYPYC